MDDWNCGIDFVELLGSDISIKVLQCIQNPHDLSRVSAVSTSWRRIVVENSLCKRLCLSMFPQLSSVSSLETSVAIDDALVKEHIVYSPLARVLTSPSRETLVYDVVCASSTDHSYENVGNTLLPGDRVGRTPSYWSSEGTINPEVPEFLLYKLRSDLCLVTEIHVQPHQGYNEVEFGCPIYSAKAVQFRLGCLKYTSPGEPIQIRHGQGEFLDNFVWTYRSPVFPMIQRKGVQKFSLPEPVVCVGGFMLIELLGRNVKHPLDGLYYICVSYVQALGKNLDPVFNIDILDDTGRCTLKYNPAEFDEILQRGSTPVISN